MTALGGTRGDAVLVIGAGHIGEAIADLLARDGARVTLADADVARLEASAPAGVATRVLDASDREALAAVMKGQRIVVSAAPFFLNVGIATAAKAAGVHYFDLTEDVATTEAVRALARDADVAFAPQCGLAPGFVGVVGHDLALRFDEVRSVQMRVGALPRFPTNALKYNLTWSTDGLINEYCNPCDAVVAGRRVALQPLEGLERFSLDGQDYEAFNTSGGLGTLAETLDGRAQDIAYRTIRYPGHRDLMKVLLDDLGMRDDRAGLKRIFERAIPETSQDVVIVFVSAVGRRRGRLVQETFATKIFGRPNRSAIQATTAGGALAMVELFLAGKLPERGFVRQEDADLQAFLATRHGSVYADGEGVSQAAPAAIAAE